MPEDQTCATIPAMSAKLRREDQLCLLLASGRLDPELRTYIQELLATPLEWPIGAPAAARATTL
jgi:hypothetical protein